MDIAIDPTTGDLDVTQGIHFVKGGDAIRQSIARRLRMILGDYFLDTRVGIDYFGHIFVKNPNLMVVRSLFRRTIAETSGVTSVSNLSLAVNRETRQLSVSFVAIADDNIIEYKDLIL